MTCSETNAATRHFAVRPGDLLPCGHAATRQADGSLACGARIRCAHCKGRHETVADVRQCAQQEADAEWEAKNDPDLAYERFLENGGAAADRIRWEHEMDMAREAAFAF